MLENRIQLKKHSRWLLSVTIAAIVFVGMAACSQTVCCTQDKCPHAAEEEPAVELVKLDVVDAQLILGRCF